MEKRALALVCFAAVMSLERVAKAVALYDLSLETCEPIVDHRKR